LLKGQGEHGPATGKAEGDGTEAAKDQPDVRPQHGCPSWPRGAGADASRRGSGRSRLGGHVWHYTRMPAVPQGTCWRPPKPSMSSQRKSPAGGGGALVDRERPAAATAALEG